MTENKLTLTRPEAAALVGLTPSGFDSWVRQGILPGPIAGTRRWSRAALERALGGEPEKVDVEEDPYLKWKAEKARAEAAAPKGKRR